MEHDKLEDAIRRNRLRSEHARYTIKHIDMHDLRISVNAERAKTNAVVRFRPDLKWTDFGESTIFAGANPYEQRRAVAFCQEELALTTLLHFMVHEVSEQFDFENDLRKDFSPHSSAGTARIRKILQYLAETL